MVRGFLTLHLLFIVALLALPLVYIARQQTSWRLKAGTYEAKFNGKVVQNDYLDCISRYHLINLEGDEVVHCLVASNLNLSEYLNQDVVVYGQALRVNDKTQVIVQAIEKWEILLWQDKILDVLGSFIRRLLP